MLEFQSTRPHLDRIPRSTLELVIGFEAHLEIRTEGATVYSEFHFPVLELADALVDWLGRRRMPATDFEFVSMDLEEPGAVWVRAVVGGWRIGSLSKSSQRSECGPMRRYEQP